MCFPIEIPENDHFYASRCLHHWTGCCWAPRPQRLCYWTPPQCWSCDWNHLLCPCPPWIHCLCCFHLRGERYTRYEQELADIKMRLQDFQIESDDIAELVRKNQNETLMSLESETCLDSREISIDRLDFGDSEQSTLCVSHVSQSNNLLEETLVMPVQVDKEHNSVEDELECKDVRTGYSVLKEELRHAQTSYEADPELADNTSSHKKISGQENDHTDIEDRKNTDNNETNTKYLEEESSQEPPSSPGSHEDVEHLLRVISDPNLDIRMEDIDEALETRKEITKSKDDLISTNQEFVKASDLIEKPPDQLFDPNDPKIRELEEWNCSMDRSLIEEDSPKEKMKNVFKMKKMSKSRDKSLLAERFGPDDETNEDEGLTTDCFNSLMLQIFVKVFD